MYKVNVINSIIRKWSIRNKWLGSGLKIIIDLEDRLTAINNWALKIIKMENGIIKINVSKYRIRRGNWHINSIHIEKRHRWFKWNVF